MMTDELIKQCRYYKGEADSPYKIESLQHTAWCFEALWVRAMAREDEITSSALSEYESLGLMGFHSDDGIPTPLKAFLANRFFYHYGREDIDEFKKFYESLYSTT